MMKRQIVLDTETTGLQPELGHRIVEIGCVEMINRVVTGKTYHQYINPQKKMDDEVIKIHGLTNDFLADKPVFDEIVDQFIEFVAGAELIMHNASFDVGFINHEFRRTSRPALETICTVVDTLMLAKAKHPGAKVNLDALCRRYQIDNSARIFHGALLDSEILAEVYLRLTGGQVSLALDMDVSSAPKNTIKHSTKIEHGVHKHKVILATEEEMKAHADVLSTIKKMSGNTAVWPA